MKKLVALLLAAAMVFALCACGAETTTASTATTDTAAATTDTAKTDSAAAETTDTAAAPAEGEPAATNRVIGTNQLLLGAYALDVITNAARAVTDICGDELQVVNDESNVEKIIADIETFIQSDVDAIFWWGLLETNFQVGPQKANEAGIPIAFPDKIPPEGELSDSIQDLEYFAGGVGCEDYLAGVNLGNYAVSLGCKKALIAGAEVGDTTHEPRIAGFIEVFEAAGGEIVDTFRGSSGNDATIAVDNMFAAHPDVDCFFGSGGDYALAAANVVGNYCNPEDVAILAVDIGPDLLPYLVDGSLAAGCGAHWVASMFAMIMLENYLDGCPMLDENGDVGIIRNVPLIVVPAEMADLYERFWIDEFPYEDDEIKALLYRYNPDVTLQDIQDKINEYSIEDRLIAKYNAGKVTAEELAAVGINVG